MHVRRLAIAAVLSLASLGVVVPASHAVVPTCNGLEATIVGTDGPDHLVGTDGADVVVLGADNDIFAGKGGDDVICGDSGRDVIYPGAGNDTVLGGDGNDSIYESAGDDVLDGGPGSNNRLSYAQFGGVHLNLDARVGTATSSNGTDTFSHFRTYVGSPGYDHLIGTSANEVIVGYGGNKDIIYSFGGDDQVTSTATESYVHAGDGDDTVSVKSPDAHVQLGAGNDRLNFSYAAGPSSFTGGPGLDALKLETGAQGYAVRLDKRFFEYNVGPYFQMPLLDFEDVIGSEGGDSIIGNGLDNYILARGGDDFLMGHGGNDTLDGGPGSDVANGGPGTDRCYDAETTASCS
jgi:Ca2+-binding RTX toxin-like protein